MKAYYVVFIRPVGSHCWTPERLATNEETAKEYAEEERNRKITFVDGSVHIQSTAIVRVNLPELPDSSCMDYDFTTGTGRLSQQ